MSLWISDAIAGIGAGHSAGTADGSFSLIMIVGIFLLFYFMMIRPQNKRAKQHRELINKLKKGDEVVLSSGILAKVEDSVNQVYIKAKLGSGVEVILQRDAVTSVLPKGTLDSL